jgi:hypothetical protein
MSHYSSSQVWKVQGEKVPLKKELKRKPNSYGSITA